MLMVEEGEEPERDAWNMLKSSRFGRFRRAEPKNTSQVKPGDVEGGSYVVVGLGSWVLGGCCAVVVRGDTIQVGLNMYVRRLFSLSRAPKLHQS